MNPEMDAIYLLSPASYVVDCLMADLEKKRYRRAFLVWTSVLDGEHRRRITASANNQQQIANMSTLTISYFPRESRLVTFRDLYSFPILYHPGCNSMVAAHLQSLAQKITGICTTLGEYPTVRYYRPRNATHEASVLCTHLARFVQSELDTYAKFNPDFPPQTARPQGVLVITDRSMDLVAPLIHEFTYQAMAHDLLPIQENDKVTYKAIINAGQADQEEKDVEISEKDEIWVKNRHEHMKDTIEKIMNDFNKFILDNPHFTNKSEAASINNIKDMLAGLPQFTTLKETYSLHLGMAQECMDVFQRKKLPDVASLEQILGTGLDEDYKKPKHVADQLVRLLDDENTSPQDRLRLIMLYVIFKDGLVFEDIPRLLAHSQLPPDNIEAINNMALLGANVTHALKEKRPHPQPLFAMKTAPTQQDENYALSRFEPAVKQLLQNLNNGTLDPAVFPYVKPPAHSEADLAAMNSASLRSTKPTWARNRQSTHEAKQRVIIFMAGGATYSESRAVYEASHGNKDCILATSHMLTPKCFVRQLTELSFDRFRLKLPQDRPKRRAPEHLFEREATKPAPAPQKSTHGLGGIANKMGGLHIGGHTGAANGSPQQASQTTPSAAQRVPPQQAPSASSSGKLEKKKDKDEGKEKKKRGFFSSKKDKK